MIKNLIDNEREMSMTENDAILTIKSYGCLFPAAEQEALCEAVNALEEIQAYRELGTVEEIQKAMENMPLCRVEHKLLQEYQNIGTVRLCKIAVERMKGGV